VNRIGVVTVTYNSGSVLEPFLDCCAAQVGQDFLLVVIDNASRDATREILARRGSHEMHVVLNDTNLGVAEGNNQGIRIAMDQGCSRVLLINNDTEFGPTLFRDLDRALTSCACDALTPRIVHHDQPEKDWFSGGEFKYFWGPDARHVSSPRRGSLALVGSRRIGYAPTCCMIVGRHVFDRIGLMSLYCDAGISMSHKVSSLTGGTVSDFFIRYHHRNQIYYVRKHYGAITLAYTLVMSFVKAALRVLVRGDSLRQFALRLRSMGEGLTVVAARRRSYG
jgi:GT2 family glycosyltransferase